MKLQTEEVEQVSYATLMTKREHYAGLALQALIAKIPLVIQRRLQDGTLEPDDEAMNEGFTAVARGAVWYADALIKELGEE